MLKRVMIIAVLFALAGCAALDDGKDSHTQRGPKKVYGGQHPDHQHQGY